MKIINNVLYGDDGVCIGAGDKIISNGFIETVLWSGLGNVSTDMRRLEYEAIIKGNYKSENIYNEINMSKIEEFFSSLGIEKTNDHTYSKRGKGNLLQIELYRPTKENSLTGRKVSLYIGNEEKTNVIISEDFYYMELYEDKLNFYEENYFKRVIGLALKNIDGNMKIEF